MVGVSNGSGFLSPAVAAVSSTAFPAIIVAVLVSTAEARSPPARYVDAHFTRFRIRWWRAGRGAATTSLVSVWQLNSLVDLPVPGVITLFLFSRPEIYLVQLIRHTYAALQNDTDITTLPGIPENASEILQQPFYLSPFPSVPIPVMVIDNLRLFLRVELYAILSNTVNGLTSIPVIQYACLN